MNFNIIWNADDIAALGLSKLGLQILIFSLAELLGGNCQKIIVSKSCYIILTRSRAVDQPHPVDPLGQTLKMVAECKYLGVMLQTWC